jgi:hypothetical protein
MGLGKSYVRVPLFSSNQAIGIRSLNQLRDNLDSMLELFSREHATADSVFDVGKSRAGAHQGASIFGEGMPLVGVYRISWTEPRLVTEPDEFIGPISSSSKQESGESMTILFRGLTAVAAVACPFFLGSAPTSLVRTKCSVQTRDADREWPFSVTVAPVVLTSDSSVVSATSTGFTLQIWGK